MTEHDPEVEALFVEFSERLTLLIERNTVKKIQAALKIQGEALANGMITGVTVRPSAVAVSARPLIAARGAKVSKRPKRLCPVPGCKNVAAPIYGMVCVEHKTLPKAEIKKYKAAQAEAAGTTTAPAPAAKTSKRPALPVG